ncbi:hypothetical protein [Chryseobacterium sp. SL1]|uniref:hypothetical protein n=1 Tax=Chryseobacterium sp. SL1 TaxID=2995159 RepID=UPI0022767088|nr:hypothetical protein [Chryseobacterium sp. SL1]MCY1663510.1 hypothetical protein [Chryseobacterium sp. SL1]
MQIVGAIVAPAAIEYKGVRTGVDFVESRYNQDDTVLVYGYSYGGDNAVNAVEMLKSKGVMINRMVLVDSSDGPFLNATVDSSIPENAQETLNIYQTDPSGHIKIPFTNDKQPSDFGPGSRGYPAKPEGDNKVINYNASAPDVSHGNIESKTEPMILRGLGLSPN